DRVVIINKGKIVADGNIKMLSQHLTKSFRVEVLFSRPVADTTFQEMKGYDSHENTGNSRYIISGNDEHLNEAIFDFAVSKQLKILEMSTRQESFEQVFRQLTASPS
ncbi:MAG: hypothetical protein M3R25_12925, partial [Bacteroidota bacterium]|nr:hypothetical protein [Bacteroidota bacterium]